MRTAIGVDLGGSHVTAAVVGEDGAIRQQHEEDLEDLRFDAVIAALETTIGLGGTSRPAPTAFATTNGRLITPALGIKDTNAGCRCSRAFIAVRDERR